MERIHLSDDDINNLSRLIQQREGLNSFTEFTAPSEPMRYLHTIGRFISFLLFVEANAQY